MRTLRHPWLLLIVLPIAIHWPELSGWLSSDPIYLTAGLSQGWQSNGVLSGSPGWIDGNAGVTLQALGHLAADDWLHGVVPWWNPYSGIGMPLAGEMQPAAFFLPFVLLLGLKGGILYLKIALQILAGLASFGLLRQLGLRAGVALVGGALFQFNGSFAWASDSPSLPIAFLPAFLLGIEQALAAARAGRPGGWALMAASLAYALLAGFPETAYIDGLLGLGWATLRLAQARGARAGFVTRLACGAAVGLLIASPVLLAFFSLLANSASTARSFAHFAWPSPLFAQILFPYLYGPIFFGGRQDWYLIGGYAGLPVVLLAAMALAAGRSAREAALRWGLAAWVALALAKTADLPGVTALWNALPFIGETMFFRYAAPSWEMALIVLACFGLDDLCAVRAHPRSLRVLVLPCAGVAALCLAALIAGRPTWRDLGSVAGGRDWFLAATGFGLAVTAGIAIAGAGVSSRRRVLLLAALLMGDAGVQFSIPLLAGTRGEARRLDLGLVGFLRQNLGLYRFYTLGPFTPNYGAYFRLASINHIYAPQPRAWIDAIHAELDPLADPVTFNGSYPPPVAGQESRPQALRRLSANYAAMGVKYVLAPAGTDPFASPPASSQPPIETVALSLPPGRTTQGSFAAGDYPAGDVHDAGVLIGTFGGRATGRLSLTLCGGDGCATGSARLDTATDNAKLPIRLEPALRIVPGDRISFAIHHDGGTTDVAIWQWKGQAADSPFVPAVLLHVGRQGEAGRLAFHSKRADVFELRDPAPYFETSQGCVLGFQTRDSVAATCSAASTLIRRELAFPGWRAEVNGAAAPVGTAGLYQAVALPAGRGDIRFRFAPPYAGLAWAACALGIGALLTRLCRSGLARRSIR